MAAATLRQQMAKRNDVTVKVDAEVVRDAKLVAVYQDKSLAELLSEVLRPAIARLLQEEQAKHLKAQKGRP